MALLKELKNVYGAKTQYWKITRIEIDLLTREATVILQGWISKDARFGEYPIDYRAYKWDGTEFPFDQVSLKDNNIVRLAYLKIKGSYVTDSGGNQYPGEFNDAVDDLTD